MNNESERKSIQMAYLECFRDRSKTFKRFCETETDYLITPIYLEPICGHNYENNISYFNNIENFKKKHSAITPVSISELIVIEIYREIQDIPTFMTKLKVNTKLCPGIDLKEYTNKELLEDYPGYMGQRGNFENSNSLDYHPFVLQTVDNNRFYLGIWISRYGFTKSISYHTPSPNDEGVINTHLLDIIHMVEINIDKSDLSGESIAKSIDKSLSDRPSIIKYPNLGKFSIYENGCVFRSDSTHMESHQNMSRAIKDMKHLTVLLQMESVKAHLIDILKLIETIKENPTNGKLSHEDIELIFNALPLNHSL